MGEDHSWMYNERKGKLFSPVWKHGLDAFLDRAFSLPEAADGRSRYPCTKCDCRHKRKRDEMELHLCRNGFQLGYELDAAVIYECVGRMPHGKLGIADGAISITEEQEIKTRKRCAQPLATAREKRLEREVKELREQNNGYRVLERVVRAMVAKGGMDYDTLAQKTSPNLATESEDALSGEHDGVGEDVSEQDKDDGGDCSDQEDEDTGEYNYDNEGYNDIEDDENFDYNRRRDFDDDYPW